MNYPPHDNTIYGLWEAKTCNHSNPYNPNNPGIIALMTLIDVRCVFYSRWELGEPHPRLLEARIARIALIARIARIVMLVCVCVCMCVLLSVGVPHTELLVPLAAWPS